MYARSKSNGYSSIASFILAGLASIGLLSNYSSFRSGETPKFIQADFIDLSKVAAISKFRSGSGHDFSAGSGETCRSMKHYFNARRTNEIEQLINKNRGMAPLPDGKTDTSIHSPVNGKIISIESDQLGKQIYIRPDSQPSFIIRLFHIFPLPGIKVGAKVRAGQKIGVIGQYQNTDIAIIKGKGKGKHISYFEAMPDNIFKKYQALGIKSRQELIISKAERDANPLKCNSEWFAENYDSNPNFGNFVYLKSASPVMPSTPASASASTPRSPAAAPASPSPLSDSQPSFLLKTPFDAQGGIYFEYFWPGESGHAHVSAGETEAWVFNGSKNPAIISQTSFKFFVNNTETQFFSGTWEKFPPIDSWEKIDYVDIGHGEYSGNLVLNPGEKGKIHYHLGSAPSPADKQSIKIKIVFSAGGSNYTIDKTLSR